MTKSEIRTQMREKRRSIAPDDKALWDRQIFQRAHKERAFQVAKRVHVFRSTPEEIDTWPFIEYAWGIGKEVVSPRVDPDGTLRHVRIGRATEWTEGPFGILEPEPSHPRDVLVDEDVRTIDAVIVPLLAFDAKGHRLGYGKGYYDGFLSRCQGRRIGIAYEFQRIPLVPTEPHDVQLDVVATNERWYQAR